MEEKHKVVLVVETLPKHFHITQHPCFFSVYFPLRGINFDSILNHIFLLFLIFELVGTILGEDFQKCLLEQNIGASTSSMDESHFFYFLSIVFKKIGHHKIHDLPETIQVLPIPVSRNKNQQPSIPLPFFFSLTHFVGVSLFVCMEYGVV